MADTEVESILREIRERVRAESALNAPPARASTHGGDLPAPAEGVGPEALARMEANLTTTERTWSRLPPLLSNRTGWVARLELWVKRQIKRAAHWFTWEQINFNSSVYHALRDTLTALSEHEKRLAESRARAEALSGELASLRQTQAEFESRLVSHRAEAEARLVTIVNRLAATESRLASEMGQLRDALAAGLAKLHDEQAAGLAQSRDEQQSLAASRSAEHQAHIADLQKELRERAESILDELRVSFKQLSLEASEAAVMHDRARRQLEARIEAMETKAVKSDK